MEDTVKLGEDIVFSQREARFAETSMEEWAKRIETLIEFQQNVDGPVKVTNVRPVGVAAGGSNGTLLFDAQYTENSCYVRRQLVLRFLPARGLFHKYDVSGQFELQRTLHKTDIPVAEQLWLDSNGEYLKVPGYIMEQVPGDSPPMLWKASGIVFDASPAQRRNMMQSYVEMLARIHSLNWKSLGLDWLEKRSEGILPIGREVDWYWDSLKWANFEDSVETFEPIRNWLISNEPTDARIVLCHGDVNLGNYLFENEKVSAVLDWEMAFLGAPECDLTMFCVGDEAVQGNVQLPEGVIAGSDIYAIYEEIVGCELRNIAYFELFSRFRTSAVTTMAMNHYGELSESMRPIYDLTLKNCFESAKAMGVDL